MQTARFRPEIAGSTLPLSPALTRQPESLQRGLGALVRCGFVAVDLVDSWLPFGDLDQGGIGVLASAITGAGLRLAGLSAIRRSIIDPADGLVNLAYTHRSIDVAAAIGGPVLSIGFHRPLTAAQKQWAFWAVPGPADAAEAFDLAVKRLRELTRHAADVNVQLSLELYEKTLLGSGAQAVRLVEQVGSDWLGINADLANIYRLPERLTEGWLKTLRLSLPYMNYWHVKNYCRAEVYPDGPFLAWPVPLAEGDIDYRLALRLAADAGYTGPLCIEHYGGDGLTAQRRGLEYLTSLLEEM